MRTLGGVGEWLKSPVSKTGIPERVSEVQILPPPQVAAQRGGSFGGEQCAYAHCAEDLKRLSISRGAERARYETYTESVRFKTPPDANKV